MGGFIHDLSSTLPETSSLHLKILKVDGWTMKCPFGAILAYFQGEMAVSFRELFFSWTPGVDVVETFAAETQRSRD